MPMKTTPKMDIPQKDTLTNVEDLSEVKRTLKYRHVLRLHYDHCHTSLVTPSLTQIVFLY